MIKDFDVKGGFICPLRNLGTCRHFSWSKHHSGVSHTGDPDWVRAPYALQACASSTSGLSRTSCLHYIPIEHWKKARLFRLHWGVPFSGRNAGDSISYACFSGVLFSPLHGDLKHLSRAATGSPQWLSLPQRGSKMDCSLSPLPSVPPHYWAGCQYRMKVVI